MEREELKIYLQELLTSIDMKPILRYIKDKYGKDYLKQFKRK